jgi:PAS domain S-box-containing protein
MIYVCPNSKLIFGLSQKQIYAKGTVQKLINGNACDLSELRKVKEISNIDWNVVDSSGRERSVLITVKSVLIDGGTVLYVIHDITEEKKSEENLRKYKNIVSSTPDAFALLDESYKYILINDSYEKFSGASRENFIGKTVPEYLGQEIFVECIKPNFDRCLKGEVVNYQEWFEYPKLGRRFVDVTYFPYYDMGNSIRGIIANTRDITDQKELEETCRQLQKMSARTERIAHIGSWEWELATDTVTWSEELYRIFQLNPDGEAPNWENHPKLYHPEDFKKLRQAAETAIADGQPYEIELRAFRKDGEIRICEVKGFPERGRDGQVIRLFGLFQDITDKKRAENSIRNNELFLKSL